MCLSRSPYRGGRFPASLSRFWHKSNSMIGGRIAALPAIVIGLFLPFTVSISEQILPENAIRVGDTIPAFSAKDDRGELFDSARLRGNPVLIKFFRAHW